MSESKIKILSRVSPGARAAIITATLATSGLACSLPTSGASLPPTETGIPATLLPTTTPRATNTPAFMIGYGSGSRGAVASETPLASETPMNTPVIPSTNTPRPTNTLAPTEAKTVTPPPSNTPVVPTNTPPPSNTPTQAPTTIRTESPTAVATATSIDSSTRLLNEAGIRVELPASDWPKTPEDAAKFLKLPASYAKNLVRVIWTDTNGIKHWTGEWMGEMWPVKTGVHYDTAKGIHIDNATGKALTDIQSIFDFRGEPTLVDITLDADYAAIYAGRGDKTTGTLPKNTGYFAGAKGTEVKQIEQLTILRPEFDLGCDPKDFKNASNLRAFRQSVREFRDNEGARNGKRQIEWYNPETKTFEKVQGQLVAEMAKAGIDMPFINKMPAGYPLTGRQVANKLGGLESQWILDQIAGDWNYEAWDFIQGVRYVPGVGHFDAQGHILVGSDRVNSGSPLAIFDFKRAVNPNLMFSSMKAPGKLPASLWVRVGGDVTATKHPQSIYTSGNGDVTVDPTASTLSKAEQAKLVIVDQNACAPIEGDDAMTRFADQLAQDEKRNHPGFIVAFWNAVDKLFITIPFN